MEEAEYVRNAIFGEEKVNRLGDSFGAAMALFYAIKYPDHLKTLISTSGFSSNIDSLQELSKLLSQLPEQYYQSGLEAISTGNFDTKEYRESYNYFYRKHIFEASRFQGKWNIAT